MVAFVPGQAPPGADRGGSRQATTVGVDSSARRFDVAGGPGVRRCANTPSGIAAGLRGLAERGGPARVGMEATGSSRLPPAVARPGAGHPGVGCDPLSSARSRQAGLARTTTDPTDARRIARSGAAHDLAPWGPASPARQRRHAPVSTRRALVRPVQPRRNRQAAAGATPCAEPVADLHAPALKALTAQRARSDRELATPATAAGARGPPRPLLTSSPGRGLVTAATLRASRPSDRRTGPRQVAADGGRRPQARSSGSSIRARGRIGPRGPAHLRTALSRPARVALRTHPTRRGFADRLRAAGTRPTVIVAAVMRTRLLLARALLRRGPPSSPTYRSATTALVAD